jgi:hypothetical protein
MSFAPLHSSLGSRGFTLTCSPVLKPLPLALIWVGLPPKGYSLFEKKDCYTPTEAKRAYDHLDRFVAEKTMSPRQAGAHRRHIADHTQVVLKSSYTARAAQRAKTEIVKLTEAGTITMKSAAAYRAHITKRTQAA